MCKLRSGHPVMLFAPLDVDRSIHTQLPKVSQTPSIQLTSCIGQWPQCVLILKAACLLWAQQGVDYGLPHDSWPKFCDHEISLNELKQAWCQPDAKTLEELYAWASPCNLSTVSIPNIQQRCQELGFLSLLDPNLDKEQEREVMHVCEFVKGACTSPTTWAFNHIFTPAVIGTIRSSVVVKQVYPFAL